MVVVRAQASQSVVVHAADAAPEALVGRLSAELASAGYTVSLQLSDQKAACEPGKGAHVTLAPDSARDGALVATICFEGTEVVVAGAEGNPTRFAISAAEALNGLRATAGIDTQQRPRAPVAPPKTSDPARHHQSVSVGQMLVMDPGGFPAFWGATVDVELGVGAHTALMLGGFLPVVRAETSTRHAELSTGVTFLRVGPALRYDVGHVAIVTSLAVGPAYTWVTADADPPYIGQSAAAFGVLSSAGLGIAYPARSAVFAAVATRASLLLPSPRILLPDETRQDLGPVLAEASLSIGLRL